MARIRFSTRLVTTGASGWMPPLAATASSHACARCSWSSRIVELEAVEAVGVEVDGDACRRRASSAIGPPRKASGETCPTTSPTDPPENRPSVMSATVMSPRPAQRGDRATSGRASRACPARRGALVADDDDVAVGERVGGVLERGDERRLALEHAGATGELPVDDAALDARDLQDGAALGREVAAQQAEAAGGLERRAHGEHDLAVGRRRVEPLELLGQASRRCR